MNRTLDKIKFAFSLVGCVVVCGLIASGLWRLFELVTGYTEGLFRLAGL